MAIHQWQHRTSAVTRPASNDPRRGVSTLFLDRSAARVVSQSFMRGIHTPHHRPSPLGISNEYVRGPVQSESQSQCRKRSRDPSPGQPARIRQGEADSGQYNGGRDDHVVHMPFPGGQWCGPERKQMAVEAEAIRGQSALDLAEAPALPLAQHDDPLPGRAHIRVSNSDSDAVRAGRADHRGRSDPASGPEAPGPTPAGCSAPRRRCPRSAPER